MGISNHRRDLSLQGDCGSDLVTKHHLFSKDFMYVQVGYRRAQMDVQYEAKEAKEARQARCRNPSSSRRDNYARPLVEKLGDNNRVRVM